MQICKFIAPFPEDYDFLNSNLGQYPVQILPVIPSNIHTSENKTLIVGWDTVKENFPNQNILEKRINNNISWTYNKKETRGTFEEDVKKFINDSLKEWLPKEDSFKIYDPIIHPCSVKEFILNNVDISEKTYIYFNKDALYMHNCGKNLIFNVKSFALAHCDFKILLAKLFNNLNCLCVSYKNISKYVDLDILEGVETIENIKWMRTATEIDENYFRIIPGFDTNKYVPFIMSQLGENIFDEEEKLCLKRAQYRDKITEWLCDRYICFPNIFVNDKLKFYHRGKDKKLAKINYSNKRTRTGRIMAHDGYNPQMLQKENDERKDIISRFDGGKIFVFDYTSFETRIALYFCDDQEFINKYYDKDLHEEVAKIIFSRECINHDEREFVKTNVTHAILYGASKATIMKKLQEIIQYADLEVVYANIRNFLKSLLQKGFQLKEESIKNGYIINKWGTIIKPDKDYAAFSNYISSTATEIIIDKVAQVREILKNRNSQVLFQVHDSIVFDIHPAEFGIIDEIISTMNDVNGLFFNVKYSYGDNYKELNNI